jgi:hypothetical protein
MDQLQGEVLLPISGAAGKIRCPPNAYMIFVKEWHQKLAAQYPAERNEEISVR